MELYEVNSQTEHFSEYLGENEVLKKILYEKNKKRKS